VAFVPKPRWRAILLVTAIFVTTLVVGCGGDGSTEIVVVNASTTIPTPKPSPTVTPTEAAEPLSDPFPGPPDPTADTPFSSTEKPFVFRAELNGWKTNFKRRIVRLDELGKSVPRDTIPAISNPTLTPVGGMITSLDPREPVIAIEVNGDARAYPLDILLQHEIVNDVIGGVPIVVTYCPLCNSAVAFERTVDGTVREFGVSGFLRKSDLIMYDNVTETMWQQITGEALVGENAGSVLTSVPIQTVSFETFIDRFKEGQVLNRPEFTGFDYDTAPYEAYDDPDVDKPFLFFEIPDRRLHVVERVSAVDIGTGPVAYAFSFLNDHTVVNDMVGDTPIVVFFDDKTESGFISAASEDTVNVVGSSTMFFRDVDDRVLTFAQQSDGTIVDNETGSTWDRFGLAISGEFQGQELVPVIHGDHFWFTWAAFKPDTRLVTATSDLVN
jgi:hypothetical protein